MPPNGKTCFFVYDRTHNFVKCLVGVAFQSNLLVSVDQTSSKTCNKNIVNLCPVKLSYSIFILFDGKILPRMENKHLLNSLSD